MSKITREDALEYHRMGGKPGKISILPTKPMLTQRIYPWPIHLVAVPVLDRKGPELGYEYTSATWCGRFNGTGHPGPG
jgi:malate dehydrogenase (oxaloacetate-decarboxylating)(NADP+)